MRKYKFKQVENYIALFSKINEGIYAVLTEKPADILKACEYLEKSQQKAIELGEYLERELGENPPTVKKLEEFCEVLYQVHEEIQSERGLSPDSAKGRLDHSVNEIKRSAYADITLERVFIFLPYKASMWDSMESIWMAAKSDENCTALVIPIPYYDKSPDGAFSKMHYEGDLFPDYVEITNYEDIDYGAMHPEVIVFHNPYDQYNYVTSVHPFFYSENLKKLTECLVYVPYFATSGGMGDGQAYMPSYDKADFLVVQSKDIINYYKRVPKEKFLPLGSPKFDSVIRKCDNPPEAPAEWKEKMAGKTVYFYNTSLNGMLDSPVHFFKKMIYVFEQFKNRDDACMIWRPHPLFESTLESLVPECLELFRDIRDKYIEEDWGIYDTTPCIEDTIALSDIYIGDGGTSVISLFGVAGKPVFILNNRIADLPTEEDWKAQIWQPYWENYDGTTANKYCVLFGNKLFWSPKDDMHFEFFCDLSDYTHQETFARALEWKEKIYVIPSSAQCVIVIDKKKNVRRIELEKYTDKPDIFWGFFVDKNYVYIMPNRYNQMVRFDMNTENAMYLTDIGNYNIIELEGGERFPNARWANNKSIYVMSVLGEEVLIIDKQTLGVTKKATGFKGLYLGASLESIDSEEVWLLPYEGTVFRRWNIVTGEYKDFDFGVDGIKSFDRNKKEECNVKYFNGLVFGEKEIIAAPNWGNKFVSLDRITEKVQEWDSPFEVTSEDKNHYWMNYGFGYFIKHWTKEYSFSFCNMYERKQYSIDLETKEINEEVQFFDRDEVYENCSGFTGQSRALGYCCYEDCFNSLKDLLDGNIHGALHNKEDQLKAYDYVNASPAGDCGEKVYEYLK